MFLLTCDDKQDMIELGYNFVSVIIRDVVMVDGDKTTKFTYKTMIRFVNDEMYVASARGNGDGWFQLSSRSFDQPQYNATLILADYFNI